jgi:hypothetical protein
VGVTAQVQRRGRGGRLPDFLPGEPEMVAEPVGDGHQQRRVEAGWIEHGGRVSVGIVDVNGIGGGIGIRIGGIRIHGDIGDAHGPCGNRRPR